MSIKLELKLEKFDNLKVFCQMERACDGNTIHSTLSGIHNDMKDINLYIKWLEEHVKETNNLIKSILNKYNDKGDKL